MTPHDLYVEATKRGLRLESAGDKLAVFPKGHCPPDFADVLRQHKAELLDWLASSPCPGWQTVPPADLPLNRQKPNPGPLDARRVVQYIIRQIGDQVGPLCEWLLRRENQYVEAFGWTVEACVYAAARDAADWQLNRSEAELYEFLAATDEIALRLDQRKAA